MKVSVPKEAPVAIEYLDCSECEDQRCCSVPDAVLSALFDAGMEPCKDVVIVVFRYDDLWGGYE